jgi:peptidoglycan/LPS O-acetylase OafA/YrhL
MRTLLAVSVLITHSAPIFGIRLLGGDTAVICFFVISGFLITLILNEKYRDLKAFYVNRALRIYTPYWSALLLSIVLFLLMTGGAFDPVTSYGKAVEGGDVLFLAWATISNMSLLGIDLLRYVVVEPDWSIVFPTFLHATDGGGHELLFVPQAWTLAIELQFYLVAPLLVRLRLLWVVGLAAGFLIMRTIVFDHLRQQGLQLDDTAIFPMMLGYFLLGALAYHGFRWWRDAKFPEPVKKWISAVVWVAGLALIFNGLALLQLRARGDYDLYFIAIAAVLPFAFYLTKDWKWDSRVGDYSYPIYVFHFVIASLVAGFGAVWQPGLWVLVITVATSTVFLRLVDAPVQRVRRRIAARGRAPSPAPVPGAAAAPAPA